MELSIGSQFSREFSFEESSITIKLTKEINAFFKDLDYGSRITTIYIGVICVSKDFDQFFTVRPLKFLRKEPAMEFELKLDYEMYKNAEDAIRKEIIVSEILKKSKEVLFEKAIKSFKKEQFIVDLESFSNTILK